MTAAPCVLLLEDETLISFAVGEELKREGYRVEPFRACAPALGWLREHLPDVGVLDVSLGNETCLEVAKVLRARSVPLLFATARRKEEGLLPGFEDVNWLEKPFGFSALLDSLQEIVASRHPQG